ncbi:DNA protection during starvation protein [Hoylesella marshii DSM 16973 = JCM 13450]|uniref:DNA protection during starvation protein n=2 Tax=Hoylesella marshii TaxID=189722 RepID=E0NUL9_9BACT|nr:DNA protection during starvation protein [Hoylesella marshii DSM 16973 = JCM 13450]
MKGDLTMKTLDYLNLDEKKVAGVVEGLSQLLADFQVYYTNLRGLHWNVRGKGFFTLHAKYEQLYNDAAEKVDEIAERLLQLGATPESRFSEYLKVSEVKESQIVHCGCGGLTQVLDTLKVLIRKERKLVSLASEAGDEVTVALMDDYLQGQEKLVWMLVAELNNGEKNDAC